MAYRTNRRPPKTVDNRVRKKNSMDIYPALWCIDEELYIAVCRLKFKKHLRGGQTTYNKKMTKDHFMPWNTTFRVGYEFDFRKLVRGEEVRCPNCNSLCDFRGFMSSVSPVLIEGGEFGDDNIYDIIKFSETQKEKV